MAIQEFLGRFYYAAASDGKDIVIDGTYDVNLNSGYRYITGYSGESSLQLCEHIETVIQAIGALGEGSMTVDYDFVDNRIEFGWAGSHSMVICASLATILGMATSQSSAQSHAGTRQPRYVWIPDQGADYHDVDYNQFWSEESQTLMARSASGVTYSVAGTMLYSNELTYSLLPRAKVITPTTGTAYADFQQFYTDVLHAGQPVRVIKDTTSISEYQSTNYVTAMVMERGGFGPSQLPSFNDFANRHIKNYQNLWDVKIPLVKHIEAS